MKYSKFFFYYFIPAVLLFCFPVLMTSETIYAIEKDLIETRIAIILIIFALINLPRLYGALSGRFDYSFNQSSTITKYVDNLKFVDEYGWLHKYYLVIFGDINRKPIWLFKFSTYYTLVGMAVLIIANMIIDLIKDDMLLQVIFISTLALIIVAPLIMFTVHLIKVKSSILLVKIPLYSIIFYILLISSYLGLVLMFANFMIRLIPVMLIGIFTNKRLTKNM